MSPSRGQHKGNRAADTLLASIANAISERGAGGGSVHLVAELAGGDINRALRVASDTADYFVKINRGDRAAMFEAEAMGLQDLAQAGALRCPAPIAWGRTDDKSFLVLEYLDLARRGSAAALGEGLAQLHRKLGPAHGWQRDNTIGSTPQPNPRTEDWADFFGRQRLGHQLNLAARNGHRGRLQRRGALLLELLPALFDGYEPAPSLLHGDLWGGNYAYLADGTPVIFDPAVYHGDRETDLAMTELFGGFEADFYAAYRGSWPLDPGYPSRRDLYQLYHVLNHLNLFGAVYCRQAEQLIESVLAQLGH